MIMSSTVCIWPQGKTCTWWMSETNDYVKPSAAISAQRHAASLHHIVLAHCFYAKSTMHAWFSDASFSIDRITQITQVSSFSFFICSNFLTIFRFVKTFRSGCCKQSVMWCMTVMQYDRRNNRVGFGAAPCQEIGTGELVLDPCDPSLIEEARSAAAWQILENNRTCPESSTMPADLPLLLCCAANVIA